MKSRPARAVAPKLNSSARASIVPGMSYSQAKAYLDNLDFKGMRLGLRNTEKLLASLGNPQRRFKVIHVAGTNGKGSTSTMISSVLTRAGVSNGLYVSPHLETFRERIQVDNEMIRRDEAAGLVAEIRGVLEKSGGPPVTYFEFMTAMAFHYFAKTGVETAVVEVGLGGRFDSTNVVDPAVSVITSIAMDHRHHLGSSLRSVAREKCGIIKNSRPVVCGVRDGAVAQTITEEAKKKSAPLWLARRDFRNRRIGSSEKGERFEFRSEKGDYDKINLPLVGKQQIDNASLAIMAALLLRDEGMVIPDSAIRAGLAEVSLPARFEIFHDGDPLIILDGAHNTKAASALRGSLVERFGPGRVDFVFGAMRDKDYKRMIKNLRPAARSFSFYSPDVPRAADVSDLVSAQTDPSIPTKTLSRAGDVLTAMKEAAKGSIFCVTGSFYTVGEIRASLRRSAFERKRKRARSGLVANI